MSEPAHIVALSGGKDSTALALRMAEVWPELDVTYFCSPTGDELPEMKEHWARLEVMLNQPIVHITNGSLKSWSDHFEALPNFRMRWCTRLLKIEPCLAYMAKQPEGSTMYVGLRADEGTREGIYSPNLVSRFPLREWGWGLREVRGYLKERGVSIPKRTDCARCYGQRIGEWWELWDLHPELYADAEDQELRTGHTFRSAARDSWPAGLKELREQFELGRTPRGVLQEPLFEDDDVETGCRVCKL
tara:strand:- start:6024 stop:6761 length:738 start_codon:yes stop_codon:yes gene_type:complete